MVMRSLTGDRARIELNSERLGLAGKLEPVRRTRQHAAYFHLPPGRRDVAWASLGSRGFLRR